MTQSIDDALALVRGRVLASTCYGEDLKRLNAALTTIETFIRAAQEENRGVGMKVEKVSGYRFPGEVVTRFTTKAGAMRVVVEADHPDFAGMLHIFNEDQLKVREL